MKNMTDNETPEPEEGLTSNAADLEQEVLRGLHGLVAGIKDLHAVSQISLRHTRGISQLPHIAAGDWIIDAIADAHDESGDENFAWASAIRARQHGLAKLKGTIADFEALGRRARNQPAAITNAVSKASVPYSVSKERWAHEWKILPELKNRPLDSSLSHKNTLELSMVMDRLLTAKLEQLGVGPQLARSIRFYFRPKQEAFGISYRLEIGVRSGPWMKILKQAQSHPEKLHDLSIVRDALAALSYQFYTPVERFGWKAEKEPVFNYFNTELPAQATDGALDSGASTKALRIGPPLGFFIPPPLTAASRFNQFLNNYGSSLGCSIDTGACKRVGPVQAMIEQGMFIDTNKNSPFNVDFKRWEGRRARIAALGETPPQLELSHQSTLKLSMMIDRLLTAKLEQAGVPPAFARSVYFYLRPIMQGEPPRCIDYRPMIEIKSKLWREALRAQQRSLLEMYSQDSMPGIMRSTQQVLESFSSTLREELGREERFTDGVAGFFTELAKPDSFPERKRRWRIELGHAPTDDLPPVPLKVTNGKILPATVPLPPTPLRVLKAFDTFLRTFGDGGVGSSINPQPFQDEARARAGIVLRGDEEQSDTRWRALAEQHHYAKPVEIL